MHISQGLAHIHSMGIAHQDVVDGNIFVMKVARKGEEELRAVVGDLGDSADYTDPAQDKSAFRHEPDFEQAKVGGT